MSEKTAPPSGSPAEPAVDENLYIAERRRKIAELRTAGENPYANDFRVTSVVAPVLTLLRAKIEELNAREAAAAAVPDDHRVADSALATTPAQAADAAPATDPGPVARSHDMERMGEDVAVAGRIIAFRLMGKAAFLRLRDGSGDIQIAVRKDAVPEAAFERVKRKTVELGDIVGVVGYPTLTRTKEPTICATDLRLLTKAVRALPDKWHGLADVETRYRQRYLDMIANPAVAEVFRRRSAMVHTIRTFLVDRGFLDVETPMMHSIVGGAAARPFRTHHNALDLDLYLRIAPELHLKRLVVGGFDRVFEIGRNFRNEGLSRQHNPEFTMLEYYWAYATYQDCMDLTEELIVQLARDVADAPRQGRCLLPYQQGHIDFTPPWDRVTVCEAIVHAAAKAGLPSTSSAELRDEAACRAWVAKAGLAERPAGDELGHAVRTARNHGHLLGALFDYLGEAALPPERPTFVVDYPAATSPLSRRKDADPFFVDRFELFVAGRELANGFSELNDAEDQRERFRAQVEAKAAGAAETMDYDEDYCVALEHGLPPTAGEGIGLDRLAMLLCDQPSIRDVILFPLLRPHGSRS